MLVPSTEYTVQIAIRDEEGNQADYAVSAFETGLLSATPFADVDWVSYVPNYPAIFKETNYSIEFDVMVYQSAANFVFGLQDSGNLFM